jgi:hypothetical protein
MPLNVIGLDTLMCPFKSSFQILFTAIKSDLDHNTQQYVSIHPSVKVSFEQIYAIRMLLAIMTAIHGGPTSFCS